MSKHEKGPLPPGDESLDAVETAGFTRGEIVWFPLGSHDTTYRKTPHEATPIQGVYPSGEIVGFTKEEDEEGDVTDCAIIRYDNAVGQTVRTSVDIHALRVINDKAKDMYEKKTN